MTAIEGSILTGRFDTPRLRVTRHDSELGYWESTEREPDPRLRGLIEGPYQGWVERTPSSMVRREVPSGIIPFIINLGPAFGVIDPIGRIAPRYVGSFVAGLHETFALVESGRHSVCIQVNMSPLGAHQILGVPMDTITNRVIELDEILGSTARQLTAELVDAPDWGTRFAILDTFIAKRVASAKSPSPGICWAWRQLIETGGLIDISALAYELNCSHKHLITQFRRELGLPPKVLARIVRFSRVSQILKRNDVTNWVMIAQRCGYYDQAHLIRDFREFAGSAPGEYIGRILPDGGGVAGF